MLTQDSHSAEAARDGVTDKGREAEKSWVAQGVKEGKTKQVGVVRKRTNKCKKEISKRQVSPSLSPPACSAKHMP